MSDYTLYPAIDQKRPRVLWQAESNSLGADLARTQVWEAFSEVFWDNYLNEAELQWLGEIITDSPFSFRELAHILTFEVAPIYWPNLSSFSSDFEAFSPTWLISRYMGNQQTHRFDSRGNPDEVPFFIHFLGLGPTLGAYLLLYRVQRIRRSRQGQS